MPCAGPTEFKIYLFSDQTRVFTPVHHSIVAHTHTVTNTRSVSVCVTGYKYYGFNRGENEGKEGIWFREWAPGARVSFCQPPCHTINPNPSACQPCHTINPNPSACQTCHILNPQPFCQPANPVTPLTPTLVPANPVTPLTSTLLPTNPLTPLTQIRPPC